MSTDVLGALMDVIIYNAGLDNKNLPLFWLRRILNQTPQSNSFWESKIVYVIVIVVIAMPYLLSGNIPVNEGCGYKVVHVELTRLSIVI
jgi:hypothetical protein